MVGVADRGGHRIGDDRQHRGEVADPEQHHRRDQVGEGRQRLQRVDHRLDHPMGAFAARGETPIGMPSAQAISTEMPHR